MSVERDHMPAGGIAPDIAGSSRLLDILRNASPAYRILQTPEVDLGIADDIEPFPFLAIVGQEEMKLALLLNIINPQVGGVLLIGARGSAKTTAVRALPDLLPKSRRSLCASGCAKEKLEQGGMDAICKDCAVRVGYGQPLTVEDRARLIELPLNARLEDVVGSINERLALEKRKIRLEQGILAQADRQILYIDEVNLLDNKVSNAILDAAAQGYYTVRRGPLNLSYRAKFSLIGSMNPEEGFLRPQMMDRFGLRAVVRGISDQEDRYKIYERASRYARDPEGLANAYANHTLALAEEVENAIEILPQVVISKEGKAIGLELTKELAIASNRAEITLFEAARAYAAADGRTEVLEADVKAVALLALRLRKSAALTRFFEEQAAEDEAVEMLLEKG